LGSIFRWLSSRPTAKGITRREQKGIAPARSEGTPTSFACRLEKHQLELLCGHSEWMFPHQPLFRPTEGARAR
jgi:hypothetical protein